MINKAEIDFLTTKFLIHHYLNFGKSRRPQLDFPELKVPYKFVVFNSIGRNVKAWKAEITMRN